MPLFQCHKSELYEWGIWKTDESESELLSVFPIEDRNRYIIQSQTFKSESRRLEWLAVRALLFQLLGETKVIAYQENGKPYLADRSANISISHTKGYVAVIVSKDREVGIDIEQYGERVRRITHKFVREDECINGREGMSTQSLLLIWSAKEVMFKCIDTQEIDFREHLYVRLPSDNIPSMYAREFRSFSQLEFNIDYFLHSDFVMTWTVI